MKDVWKDIKSKRLSKFRDDIGRIVEKINSLEDDIKTDLPEHKDDIIKFTLMSKGKLYQAQSRLDLLSKEVWK